MNETYRGAGRRLFAAIISHRLGLKSVDYALKRYVPAEIDNSWAELAEALDRHMTDDAGKALCPPNVTETIQ